MNNKKPHWSERGRTKTAATVVQAHSTPIYVGGKVVGKVQGDTFYKSIRKNHFLQRPPAIASDIYSVHQAEESGTIMVQVTDIDNGTIYRTTIQHLLEHGKEFNRGYGDQIFLELNGWNKFKSGGGLQLPLFRGEYDM